MVKEESARSSPELASESLSQRRHQPVPVHYLSFQSENSAFDRVMGKAAGSARQPTRGYVQPADPVHTAVLVTSETPENVSECSWVESAPQSVIKPSALKVLEGERKETPVLHICESQAEDDVPLAEALEKSKKALLALEDGGLERSLEDASAKKDFGKPTLGIITSEHRKESESPPHPPQAQNQFTEKTGRSEMVLYVQREPVTQDARVTDHKKEAPRRKHKVLTRSLSDYTGPPQLQALRGKGQSERQSSRAEGPHAEASVLDTKVSVAQLRNAFLQPASASKKPEL